MQGRSNPPFETCSQSSLPKRSTSSWSILLAYAIPLQALVNLNLDEFVVFPWTHLRLFHAFCLRQILLQLPFKFCYFCRKSLGISFLPPKNRLQREGDTMPEPDILRCSLLLESLYNEATLILVFLLRSKAIQKNYFACFLDCHRHERRRALYHTAKRSRLMHA